MKLINLEEGRKVEPYDYNDELYYNIKFGIIKFGLLVFLNK